MEAKQLSVLGLNPQNEATVTKTDNLNVLATLMVWTDATLEENQ